MRTVVVVVEPMNDAPEAMADTAATAEDEPVVIDVLANDMDVEGDALRVESVSRPEHGTARAAANGSVEYTPGADYYGSDRFTYTVSDGNANRWRQRSWSSPSRLPRMGRRR